MPHTIYIMLIPNPHPIVVYQDLHSSQFEAAHHDSNNILYMIR